MFLSGITGHVSTGDVPVPGAVVTATRGNNRFVTITNQHGEYFLPAAEDDTWIVQIEMLGFATSKGAASTTSWELKLLPFEEIPAAVVKPEPSGVVAPAEAQPAYVKVEFISFAEFR
jgi:hypothetical protein